ncbi:hypothetical protein Emtol_2143 [Emticicia oligotrophica DSM 17448]|uniref:Lipoprotein n=1 Tax=Emticicia oligotrophica (strain DSM 17448 / CIP 109782 / MTCC 6937 / GPTSA100-15) TaxID=929562 RepID=A0ABM5N1K2_EMTOG|nr:hypothetical protein [Emticicia oligotrophica]AFK03281.1 hypothetical protein Emtol_2143 [Emticicia oligotrophica DSM 17448]
MRKLLFISLLLAGCTNSETTQSSKIYFDLAGLVNQQIASLTQKQPLAHKSLLLEEKTEAINTTKIDWKKEFELFLQADLNKQSYQLSYDVAEGPQKLSYTLKKGESLPVKLLVIVFDEKERPIHIEALLQTKNYLYESEKHLQMNLENNQVINYQIIGWQELFVGKRKNFKVNGILVNK